MGSSSKRKRRQKRRRNLLMLMRFATIAVLVIAIVLGIGLFASTKHRSTTTLTAAVPSGTTEPTVQVSTPEPTAAPTAEPTIAPTATPELTAEPMPTDRVLRSVRFRVTGDLMASSSILKYASAAANGSGYDFSPMFTLVSDLLSDADYTMGNLETTIGKYKGKDYSGYPMFNTPESYLDALKGAGFDFLTLANNHMLDRYFDGMKNTVTNVEAAGFDFCGAYRTQEERNTPTIVEINGIKFGFLSYTQMTNGMENHSDEAVKTYGVPYLLSADLEGDIARLREAGAEVVIVFPHWGEEYIRTPNDTEVLYAKKLAAAGADIILASHPHVLQAPSTVTVTNADGTMHTAFVAYSLGNFVATQEYDYTDTGVILDFTVQEKSDGTFQVMNVGYIPTYIWRHDNTLTVVPSSLYLDERPEGMSSSTYEHMLTTCKQTQQLFGKSLTMLTE